MPRKLGRLALGVLVAMLGLSGLSYAGTGAPNPVKAVATALHDAVTHQDEAVESPEPSDSPEPTESPEATESPEPSESPEASEVPGTGVQRSTSGCPQGTPSENHGQFVSSSDDKEAAAHSDCGMPEPAVAAHEAHPSSTEQPPPSEHPSGGSGEGQSGSSHDQSGESHGQAGEHGGDGSSD